MACVGLSYRECVERFGVGGFDAMYATEHGMDRADMERFERDTEPCFVELRVDRSSGSILGCSACGPAAAELTNSMGLAITNGLTVADVARSAHSYPSYSYLLYRIALSMALSSTWGVLEACGPIGKRISKTGRRFASTALKCRAFFHLPKSRRNIRRRQQWQAEGASRALYFIATSAIVGGSATADTNIQVVSYLDVFQNSTLQHIVEELVLVSSGTTVTSVLAQSEAKNYMTWRRHEP